MVLRKSFYIHWSAGRSPRVHEVNPGRDPSWGVTHVGDHHYWALLTLSRENYFRYREFSGRRRSLEAGIMKRARLWP